MASCNQCNNGCQSCQGGCQSCQVCNSGCQRICESYQLLREQSITNGNFQWSLTPEKGVLMGPKYAIYNEDGSIKKKIFNKTRWDEIFTYINYRAKVGNSTLTDGVGGSTMLSSNETDVKPFSASEFNRVVEEVNKNLSSSGTKVNSVKSGQIIRGEYFQNLAKAVNSMNINSKACNNNNDCKSCQVCNGGCNADCNKCEGCISSCNSTCNGCYSCVLIQLK